MENNIKKSKETNIKIKEITPPYLTVVRLEALIKLISSRTFSDISASLFKKYGFKNPDNLLAINTLKFLGLVDEKGKPTNLMPKLRLQGSARKQEFEKIIRAAYKKLFDAVDKPYTLSREELSNEFVVHYDISNRVVISAVPSFLKLCEFAGLIEETQVRKIKKVKRGENSRQTGKEHAPAGFFSVRVAEGRMLLSIPSELQNKIIESDDNELHKDWRNLRAELKKFADKYIPDNLSENEAPAENAEGV